MNDIQRNRLKKQWSQEAQGDESLQKGFQKLAHHKMIENCPVMTDDMICIITSHGLCLADLRDKTMCVAPDHVKAEYASSKRLYKTKLLFVLTADVMFINGVPLLTTPSNGTNQITVESAATRIAKLLTWHILHVLHMLNS